MRTVVPLAVAAASVVLLAGCGAAGPGGGVTDEPTDGSGASDGAATELTIVVRTGPGQGKRAFSLSCEPPGGDHPDAEAACRALDELERPFAQVPAGTACTEIYGGAQTARVTGTFRGDTVNAEFNRTNGCEIDRWDAHVALLVEAGGA